MGDAMNHKATLHVADAGPLLCGGITVFAPLAMYAKPTDRVGIIGIGGLGHMAVQFAAAYGCDVTAFTSSESTFDEAKGFGANHVVSTLLPACQLARRWCLQALPATLAGLAARDTP
jgi:D-arabinose 1-dehydrogenase-like Zn-dependent alcohol dehydrogenase